MLEQLYSKILGTINIKFSNTCFYIDSTTKLAWTESISKRWKTFIANGVGKLKDLQRLIIGIILELLKITLISFPVDVIPRYYKNLFYGGIVQSS